MQVPGISRAAGGMGIYGGLAANSRLQAAAGLDRVLFEHAKWNTTWQVIGLSTAFRAISQLAIENPWGLGPKAVTRCSRPALQGTPVHHVPTPKRRKGKKGAGKKSKARAAAQRPAQSGVDVLQGTERDAQLPQAPVPVAV